MSYVAMATPMGPWIAPSLALASLIIARFVLKQERIPAAVGFAVAGGSVGGIIATAFAFSFPTLFFLENPQFMMWLKNPVTFCAVVTCISLIGSLWGFCAAFLFEQTLLYEQQLPFPIGQLTARLISSGGSIFSQIQLLSGFILSSLCIFFQQVKNRFISIPQVLVLTRSYSWGAISIPSLSISIMPLLWAVGFIAGISIAGPLTLGAILKIFIVDPLHSYCWADVSTIECSLAFCSGIVFLSTLQSIWSLRSSFSNASSNTIKQCIFSIKDRYTNPLFPIVFIIGLTGVSFYAGRYIGMSLPLMIYALISILVFTYLLLTIAGKIGLALLGRFATYVMIPALLFTRDPLYLILLSTIMEICGGVATDLLFGRKMTNDLQLSQRSTKLIQLFGIIISSVVIGAVLWLLITHVGLGTPALLAQKAKSRQLLLQVKQFNIGLVVLGAIVAQILSWFKVNIMLVLGGILMPLSISTGLMLGGFLSYIVPEPEQYESFWSGVFTANALAVIIIAIYQLHA